MLGRSLYTTNQLDFNVPSKISRVWPFLGDNRGFPLYTPIKFIGDHEIKVVAKKQVDLQYKIEDSIQSLHFKHCVNTSVF